jgi:hypothetical protein
MISRAYAAIALSGFALALVPPAQARIVVTRADYKAGVLVVSGRTDSQLQRVVLDGRYNEWTNEARQFRFRVRYLPDDCRIRLEADDEVRKVRIAGCNPLRKPSR